MTKEEIAEEMMEKQEDGHGGRERRQPARWQWGAVGKSPSLVTKCENLADFAPGAKADKFSHFVTGLVRLVAQVLSLAAHRSPSRCPLPSRTHVRPPFPPSRVLNATALTPLLAA